MTDAHDDHDPAGVRQRILAAATSLLADGGARAVTTRAVAEAAGVQPPTLYRLFGDKDGLLDAVAEHVFAAYTAEKAASDAGRAEIAPPRADPLEELRVSWNAHVAFGAANPDLYLLLLAPGRGARSPATVAGIEVLRAKVTRLAVAGRLRTTVESAMSLLHAAGVGATVARIEGGSSEEGARVDAMMFDAVASAIVDHPPLRGDMPPVLVAFQAMVPTLPGLSDAERALMGEWVAKTVSAQRVLSA